MALKLGKRPAKIDKRTILFKSIVDIPKLPVLPDKWEFSEQYPQFDLSPQEWGNLTLGNCVYVASMAQQRDFEVIEQGQVIPIDEKAAEEDYKRESGGDYGLVMLDHLNRWRKEGLPFGQRKLVCITLKRKYKIHAYASIDMQDKKEMMYSMFLLGCNIGALMPDSFGDQFNAGHPWDDVSLPPNPYNGHAMKPRGWTKDGVLLWTWGKLQLATWPWIHKYCDEGYVILDARNKFLKDSPIDIKKLEEYLVAIREGENSKKPT